MHAYPKSKLLEVLEMVTNLNLEPEDDAWEYRVAPRGEYLVIEVWEGREKLGEL